MAEKNLARLDVSDSINDLIIPSSRSSIFNEYRNKREVGVDIFSELYRRFSTSGKRKGFYLADNTREIGILSQCQSLQALMLLATDYGLDFTDENLRPGKKENISIRDIMDTIIEDILDNILPPSMTLDDMLSAIKYGEPTMYRFDASPYNTESFSVEYSNIDTITWVITTFLLVLKHHAGIGEICKWEDILVDVIAYGLRYINKSFITSDPGTEGASDKLEIGWNFTNDCQEPSLYYTFTVCECYLDFYETFSEYLEYLQAERNEEKHGIPIPDSLEETKKVHAEQYQKMLDRPDPGVTKEGKERTKFDEYHELVRLYKKINKCLDVIDGTLYGELEEKCKRTAKEVWRLVKDGFGDNFYYNDLHTTITEAEIKMSTTSDALFNTVYIINVILDAGLDEDIHLEQEIATINHNDELIEKAKRDYNDLLEVCQLANQRAFRTYEKLKKDGKEYIVDQFLVGFNERFDKHREWIKDLRKLRMRVFSLTPLLIKTNTVISDYLIRYPQSTMRKYLGYILDNRFVEKGETKWIWETDGYFSASNYYYVSALKEFYAYHDTYEQKFFNIEKNNVETRKAIVDEHMAELESTGEIRKLKDLLADKEVEIEKLKKQKEEIKTPVEDAVTIVIKQVLKETLPNALTEFINEAADGLTCTNPKDYKVSDDLGSFAGALKMLAFALISKQIQEISYDRNRTPEANEKAAKEMRKNIEKDFERCLSRYIGEIKNSESKRSQFYND